MGWELAPVGGGSTGGIGAIWVPSWRPRLGRRTTAALLAALLAALSGASLLPLVEQLVAPDAASTPDDGSTVDSLDDLAAADQASIQAQIAAAQYHFSPMADGSVVAGNPAAGIDARLSPTGLRINPTGALDRAVDLSVVSFGRPGSAIAAGIGAPSAVAGSATVDRGGLVEWFRNDARGLEQGFTVREAPTGAGPLVVDLGVSGAAITLDTEDDARFVDAAGSTIASYRGLTVVDADGEELDARFDVVGSALRVEVDDTGASYPVVIDPVISSGEPLRPEDLASTWNAGQAVARDGEVIVVGAPGADFIGANGIWGEDDGAAYAFVNDTGTPGAWELRGIMTLPRNPSTPVGAGLGSSVDVQEEADGSYTVAAGAPYPDRSGSPFITPNGFVLTAELDPDTGALSSVNEIDLGIGAGPARLGTDVALEGDRLLIGAPGEQTSGPAGAGFAVGAAYVASRTPTDPDYNSFDVLNPPDGIGTPGLDGRLHFGTAVDLHNGVAYVGAPGDDLDASPSDDDFYGAVWTFDGNAGWARGAAPLLPSIRIAGSWFGSAIDVAPDGHVAVGAPGVNLADVPLQGPSAPVAGTVHIFSPGSTTERETIGDSQPQGPGFGASIALGGDAGTDVVLVGSSLTVPNPSITIFAAPQGERFADQPLGGEMGRSGYGAAVDLDGLDGVTGIPYDGSLDLGREHGSAVPFVVDAGIGDLIDSDLLVPPGAAGRSLLGYSLAQTADLLVVGAPGEVRSIDGDGAAYVFGRSSGPWQLEAILAPSPDAPASELSRWGNAVDVFEGDDGAYVLVGAPTDDVDAVNDAGSATLFIRPTGAPTFEFVQELTAASPELNAFFGGDVSIGDSILIASPMDDTAAGADAGSVSRFTGAGATWTPAEVLVSGQPGANRQFGTDIARGTEGQAAILSAGSIGGNILVDTYVEVGGALSALGTVDTGADNTSAATGGGLDISGDLIAVASPDDRTVRVLATADVQTGPWTSTATITAPADVPVAAGFGTNLSLARGGADRLVVGAPRQDVDGVTDAGEAFLYSPDASGSTWTLESRLRSGRPTTNARYGWRTTLWPDNGGAAISSFPGGIASSPGQVETLPILYRESVATVPPGTSDSAEYVRPITQLGDLLFIGTPAQPVDGVDLAGKVDVFRRIGTSWVWQEVLTAPDPTLFGLFGWSVEASGDQLFVGSIQDDPSGIENNGSVFVFEPSDGDLGWEVVQHLIAPDTTPSLAFGYGLAADGDDLWVSAILSDGDGSLGTDQDYGSAYAFRRVGGQWQPVTTALSEAPASSEYYGAGMDVDDGVAVVGSPNYFGTAYVDVWRWNGTTWVRSQRIDEPNPDGLHYWAQDIAIGGGVAAFGRPGQEGAGVEGELHIYDVGPSLTAAEVLRAVEPAPDDYFGFYVDMSPAGDRLLTSHGPPADEVPGPHVGAVYRTSDRSLLAELTSGPPIAENTSWNGAVDMGDDGRAVVSLRTDGTPTSPPAHFAVFEPVALPGSTPPPTSVFVDVSVPQPTVVAGAAQVPTAGLPPSLLTEGAGPGSSIAAASLSGVDLATPPAGTSLAASPLSSLPLSSLPLSSLELAGSPLSSLPLSSLPLSSLPLDRAGGWEALLAGSPFAGLPLQSVSFQDVLDLPAVQDLTIGEVGLAASPLSSLPLSSLVLGGVPLSSLPIGDSAEPLADWCTTLPALGFTPSTLGLDCTDLAAPGNAKVNLLSISLAGVPLSSLPLSSLPLSSLPLSSLPLSSLPLSSLDLAASPLSSLPLSSLPLSSLPLSSLPLSSLPLSSLPLSSLPLSSLPLSSLPLSSLPLSSLDLSASPLSSLPLSSLDLAGAPLSSLPLSSLPLSSLPLSSLPLSSLPLSSLPLSSLPLSSLPLSSLPLSSLPLSSLDLVGAPLSSLPLSSLPLSSLPLSSLPLSSLPLSSLALAGSPLSSLPLSAVVDPRTSRLQLTALAATPLSSLAAPVLDAVVDCSLISCVGAADLGAASYAGALRDAATLGDVADHLAGVRFDEITSALGVDEQAAREAIADALGSNADLGDLDGYDDLTLGELPAELDGTLAQLIPGLAGYRLADLGSHAGTEAELRAQLAVVLGDDADLGDLDGYDDLTLGDLPSGLEGTLAQLIPGLAGYRLADLLGLAGDEAELRSQVADALGADADLRDLDGYDDLTLGELPDFQGTTLAQLLANVDPAELEDITLGDLILALLSRTQYPWERLDLSSVSAQVLDGVDDSIGVAVRFRTLAFAGGPRRVRLEVQIPEGWSYRPGGAGAGQVPVPVDATLVVDPPGQVVGDTLSWTTTVLPGDAPIVVALALEPSLSIGTGELRATASIVGEAASGTDTAPLTVLEATEPNDTLATAVPLVDDAIHLSHISSAQDLDVYSFQVDRPGRASLILSNLDADLDAVLLSPPASSTAIQEPSPRSILPVEDEAASAIPGSSQVAPEPVDDLAQPLELGDLAVNQASINRGTRDERIDTGTLTRTGTYYVVVSGYNGAVNRQPYTLRLHRTPAALRPACPARVVPTATPAGAVPSSLPAGTNTLFLVNASRFAALHAPTDTTAVSSELAELLAYVNAPAQDALGVQAAVVDVGLDPQVRAAYAAWDASPCGPEAANAVVAEIVRLVDQYRDAGVALQHVVVVGGDDAIPFARVPDRTEVANERDYAQTFGDSGNALFATFDTAHVMTDDAYGDLDPYGFGDRVLFVNDTSVGRLVEGPNEIADQLGDFVAAGGLLDVGTGLVTGYDFLTDGAESIARELEPTVTGPVDRTLISDTWTRQDLEDAIDAGSGPDIAAINAHFDHFRALPADGNASGDESDLFTAAAVRGALDGQLAGSVVFSMGCHGGLSVSDGLVGADRELDFAQAISAQGGVFVGNTGYGYGDTELVELSERLLTLFARRLDGALSVGEALLYAKAEYAADLTAYGVYDEKAMMEATLYGLPFYRLDVADPPPVPPLPSAPQISTDPITGIDTTNLRVVPTPEERTDAATGETYFVSVDPATGEELTTAVHDRPVQPREEQAFATPPGMAVHDALITELTTTDTHGVLPHILQPIVDDAAEAPDVDADVVFPSNPVRVNPQATPAGATSNVAITTGYFRTTSTDGTGVQRLMDEVTVSPYLTDDTDTDFAAPTFASVDATIIDGILSFGVTVDDAGDPAGVRRVYVLAVEDPAPGVETTWRSVDLVQTPGTARWSGSLPIEGDEVEYLVQAVDASGNVGITTNKALNFRDAALPLDPPNTDLQVDVAGTLGGGGWYTSPVTLTASGGAGLTYELVGEGGSVPYTGPIAISDDGPHVVVVRSADGQQVTTVVKVDTAGPTATTPITSGEALGLGTGVAADYACLDPGSGPTSCTATLDGSPLPYGADLTAAAGSHTLIVTSGGDVAGNAASIPSVTVTYAVVGAPDVTAVTGELTGSMVSLAGTYTGDPAGSPYRAIIDWGDGTTTTCTEGTPTTTCSISGGSVSASRTFASPPTLGGIVLTVANRFGGADAASPAPLAVLVDGTLGNAGWYVSPVTVTATAGGGGVTYDRSDDAAGFLPMPAGGVTFSSNGSYTVLVRGGGDEQAITFDIDRTGPSAVLGSPVTGAYYNASAPVSSGCIDGTSGITTCTVTLDGAPFSGTTVTTPGQHTLVVTAGPDVAGNPPVVPTRSATFTVLAPPDVTSVVITGDGAVAPGSAISATAAFTGVAAGAPYTATFNWGDGTPNTTCTSGTTSSGCSVAAPSGSGTTGSATATHTYGASTSNRTITVTIANRAGGSDVGSTTVYVCTITGTAAANTLNGTAGNDVICGLGGNDTINGNGGDDRLFGGDGTDTINGGTGNDLASGGAGNDTIRGGDGNDIATGGIGDDKLYGDNGSDLLSGDEGTDAVEGGNDSDVLDGGIGNDTLRGLAGNDLVSDLFGGNDKLYGGDGTDVLIGGSGDDQLFGENNDDLLDAGDGVDALDGGAGGDTLDGGTGADALLGGTGTGVDALYGQAGADVLRGGDGNDGLRGGLDNDQLLGENGDDDLDGGPGNDALTGGSGTDTCYSSGNPPGTDTKATCER